MEKIWEILERGIQIGESQARKLWDLPGFGISGVSRDLGSLGNPRIWDLWGRHQPFGNVDVAGHGSLGNAGMGQGWGLERVLHPPARRESRDLLIQGSDQHLEKAGKVWDEG